MNVILEALYLVLPVYVANAAPHLVQWIPWGNTPLDHRKSILGKRIFGDHKTYRGAITSIVTSTLTVFLQYLLFPYLSHISLLTYGAFSLSYLVGAGFLFGASYVAVDLAKSFLKRRMAIPPGAPWVPFDQIDLSISALIAARILVSLSWYHVIVIAIVSVIAVVIANFSAYLLGMKKVWW